MWVRCQARRCSQSCRPHLDLVGLLLQAQRLADLERKLQEGLGVAQKAAGMGPQGLQGHPGNRDSPVSVPSLTCGWTGWPQLALRLCVGLLCLQIPGDRI